MPRTSRNDAFDGVGTEVAQCIAPTVAARTALGVATREGASQIIIAIASTTARVGTALPPSHSPHIHFLPGSYHRATHGLVP
jgi:hypothetical protein